MFTRCDVTMLLTQNLSPSLKNTFRLSSKPIEKMLNKLQYNRERILCHITVCSRSCKVSYEGWKLSLNYVNFYLKHFHFISKTENISIYIIIFIVI